MTVDIHAHATFYDRTQRLLLEAKNKRDGGKLLRAKLKIDDPRFTQLPEPVQEDLLALYAEAMMATGYGSAP